MTYLSGSLTTVADVKRITRLTNELTDGEIGSFIYDVTRELYNDHGWPIKISSCYVDADTSTYYLLPKLQTGTAIHGVDQVLIDGSTLDSGSYTSSDTASIILADGLATTWANKEMHIGWTPIIFHNLATFKVAFDIIQAYHIISGDGGEFPRTSWLKQRIEMLEKQLVDGLYMSSQSVNFDHYTGNAIYQDDIGGSI